MSSTQQQFKFTSDLARQILKILADAENSVLNSAYTVERKRALLKAAITLSAILSLEKVIAELSQYSTKSHAYEIVNAMKTELMETLK